MKYYRLAAAAALGTLTATLLTVTASAAPDPAYPTGSFTIAQPVQYVVDRDGDQPERAFVTVKRLALSDDETPAENLVVRLYAGTDVAFSTNGQVWDSSRPTADLLYGGALPEDPVPVYHLAGTYHPYVTVTDEDGNTTTINLPTVTLLNDNTAPVTKLTLPPAGKRNTILAWRYVRGTSVDAGINRPASGTRPYTAVTLLQKRGAFYYVYHPASKRWVKGLRTEAATYQKIKPEILTVATSPTGWRTPYIQGLTRGRLVVIAWSQDDNLNESPRKVLARSTITKRR